MATEKEGSEAGLMRETATAAGRKCMMIIPGGAGVVSPGGERIAGASPGRWRRTGLAAGDWGWLCQRDGMVAADAGGARLRRDVTGGKQSTQ